MGKPFYSTMLLVISLFLASCAANSALQGKRDPKELYDSAMTSYYDENYEEAEKTFKRLMDDYPLSNYSVEAQLMLGDLNYSREGYEEAGTYYTNFVAMHPTHPRASYALFQKGMSHFKEILSVDRDQTATRKALFAFEDLVASYPDSPYREKADELIVFLRKRLAEREFYVAKFYFNGKNYRGALSRLRDLIKAYPDAGFTDQALYYIGESYMRLGEEGLAKDAFTTLIENFPESPFVKVARIRLNKS